jgi:hypothetical protein
MRIEFASAGATVKKVMSMQANLTHDPEKIYIGK